MTPIRELDLDALQLLQGAHASPEEGMCVVEAVAWMAGERFSDHPACTSPVIAAFCRSWNDSLELEDRNRLLKPLIPTLIGTRTTAEDEETRAWMATDWLARVQAPAWLELAALGAQASALRALPALTSSGIAKASQAAISAARNSAAAAVGAAGAAAWAAAWDAEGAAIRRMR